MTHTEQRLAERGIHINQAELQRIAKQFNDDVAVIMSRGEHKGDNVNEYRSRKESNGDLVVLIVRDRYPVTVMYRRSNQDNRPAAMRVNRIVEWS
jgi:hypothetical protein